MPSHDAMKLRFDVSLVEFMETTVLAALPGTLDGICDEQMLSEVDRDWVTQVLDRLRASGQAHCEEGVWRRGAGPVRTRYERMLSDD